MESFKGAGTIYAYMNTLKGASSLRLAFLGVTFSGCANKKRNINLSYWNWIHIGIWSSV